MRTLNLTRRHANKPGAIERAALALGKRGHKTSVSGTNYLVHLPRSGNPKVWCGRERSAVNSYPDAYVSPYAPEEEEQTCLACIKARVRAENTEAGKISLPEA